MLELIGENFTPSLKVWFADVEAETLHRFEQILNLHSFNFSILLFLFFHARIPWISFRKAMEQ